MTVQLSIGEHRFKISRSACPMISIFADMFKLSPVCDTDLEILVLITARVDKRRGDRSQLIRRVRALLWYLHVSPAEFEKWDNQCNGETRFRACSALRLWPPLPGHGNCDRAVARVVTLLPATVKRLYDFALRSDGVDARFQIQCRDYCERFERSYLQAHAYFHILKSSNSEITSDPRLTVVDRLRLLLGVTNLGRFSPSGDHDGLECECLQHTNVLLQHLRVGVPDITEQEYQAYGDLKNAITGKVWNVVTLGYFHWLSNRRAIGR
ncbi:hypothetical protein BKA62DRAFT_763184 [Auriculariales sp. MPI-PUGE-AT-0066]|nr:hypothetical protein BKA62DRAFT_763184 [Auriculariales sp. MPI-PUGE-AT-0066]